MEKEIKISNDDNLDSTVYLLLAARARGEKAFVNFGGHILHSDTVSMDSAYIEVRGATKEEFIRRVYEAKLDNFMKKINNKISDLICKQKIDASRRQGVNQITYQNVVNGLKFIAEHLSMPQEDWVDELLQLGCNFSIEEVKSQFPNMEDDGEKAIINGDLAIGASIIAKMMLDYYSRCYYEEIYFDNDDKYSAYNYIRILTGDRRYTKEYADSLNKSSEIHR